MTREFWIDEEKVNRVEDFFKNIKHTKGRWKGSPFILNDWEKKIVRDVFGTVDQNGIRKYRTVYIEIPKKNGKSPFAAGIAAYMLSADREPSPEVYVCAVDKDQAGIVFKYSHGMIQSWDALKKKVKPIESQKTLINKSNDGVLKALSADVPNKHGVSPSCVIFDELHAQPNRELWDVMTQGTFAAREQPLLIVITTAGLDVDRTSICWEIRQRAVRVLNGESAEDDFYAVIYGLGEDKDWTEGDYWKREENWYKANPSLGETIKIEDMRSDFNAAIGNPAMEQAFKQLRLNIWVTQRRVTWLPIEEWDKGNIPIDINSLLGRDCYGGLDIGSTRDLTAFVLLFPNAGIDGRDVVLPFFWIPNDTLIERVREDRFPYNRYVTSGYLTATSGNVIDQDYIEREILDLAEQYNILEIGLDRHDASMLRVHLENNGLNIVPVNQSMAQLSPTIKEVERHILRNDYQHGGNPLLRFCYGNILVYRDVNENIKLNKASAKARIDGIDALVNAEHRRTANTDDTDIYYGGISSIEF